VTPLVLVHGGSCAAPYWDLVVERIDGPVLAVDLPGRRGNPAPLESVTLESAAGSVVADIDAAGFDSVALVGHSLAGCSMPGTIGLLGDRARHAVFVACTVPEHGTSALDTLPEEFREFARDALAAGMPDKPNEDMARLLFGTDLDEEQFTWMCERLVPEAPALVTGAVDLTPLASDMPRTWVRTLRDAIIDPDKQLRFARNAGDCEIVDIDTGHMCMVSTPDELAAILSEIAERA
jgi:pimeloyl-ACP methyl ester carboxylesterase